MEAHEVMWFCVFVTDSGWFLEEHLRMQELSEEGAGITDVMGRWAILDREPKATPVPPDISHMPPLTRKSVSLLVGKVVWSSEKTKVIIY